MMEITRQKVSIGPQKNFDYEFRDRCSIGNLVKFDSKLSNSKPHFKFDVAYKKKQGVCTNKSAMRIAHSQFPPLQ